MRSIYVGESLTLFQNQSTQCLKNDESTCFAWPYLRYPLPRHRVVFRIHYLGMGRWEICWKLGIWRWEILWTSARRRWGWGDNVTVIFGERDAFVSEHSGIWGEGIGFCWWWVQVSVRKRVRCKAAAVVGLRWMDCLIDRRQALNDYICALLQRVDYEDVVYDASLSSLWGQKSRQAGTRENTSRYQSLHSRTQSLDY